MIEASELSKRYGKKTAVDALTFTIRPGRVTGFLGPNGAGKSTTLRLALGLHEPTSGTVTVDGVRFATARAACATSAPCSTRTTFTAAAPAEPTSPPWRAATASRTPGSISSWRKSA